MKKSILILFLCCFITCGNVSDYGTVFAKSKTNKTTLSKKKSSANKSKKKSTRKLNNRKSNRNSSSAKNQYYNEKGDLKQHQKDLDNLTKSITQAKQKLNNLQKIEKNEVSKLNQHKQKSTILKKDITKLKKKINEFQDTIGVLKYQKETLNNRLHRMQKEYAGLLKEYYLNSNTNSVLLISSVSSPFDEIRKSIYMNKLTKKMGMLAHQIIKTNDSINQKEEVYEEITNVQFGIKNKKELENNKVQKTIDGQEVKIDKIRKDKNLLAKQLADMQSSARKLKGIVNQLIQNELAKEKKKNEAITSKTTSKETRGKDEIKHSNDKFASLSIPSESKRTGIGRLVWPTNNRSISKYYGESRNPETNTIFDNPGIDITANVGSPVIASADGVVSLIHWLPGYGTLIIINHGGGVRTVYANLSTVNVKKDQSVKQGAVIGRTGQTVDGASLHFELWQGSSRLNPLGYLR
jgi:septal ring factor EnvC (AmiA/AmiB activator)